MSLRLLLLGAPGAGKGTQTTRILRDFPHIQALSSGDVLRSQMNQKTAIGKEAQQYIHRGQLVPDKTMVGLITAELEGKKWLTASSNWLLDGFPRTMVQAQQLEKVLGPHDINLVIELDVDQSVILQRIEARWVHPASGRVYNLDYNPPKEPFKDDLTGEELVKRDDDTKEVFQRRLDKYNDEIGPLRRFYKEKGVLQAVSGNTSDAIYPKIRALLDSEAGSRPAAGRPTAGRPAE